MAKRCYFTGLFVLMAGVPAFARSNTVERVSDKSVTAKVDEENWHYEASITE
ncbi:MAG: hypothetical protein AABO41_27570 [Acidobacteriota bacterium]